MTPFQELEGHRRAADFIVALVHDCVGRLRTDRNVSPLRYQLDVHYFFPAETFKGQVVVERQVPVSRDAD